MSCFVVSENCINDVITLIKKVIDLKSNLYNDGRKLGKDLFNMNLDAFVQRYRYDEQKYLKITSFQYKKSKRIDLVQYYNFCCLEYQCSEGNVPETPFYRFVFQSCMNFIEDYLYKKYIGGSDPKNKYRDILFSYIKEHNIEVYWGK